LWRARTNEALNRSKQNDTADCTTEYQSPHDSLLLILLTLGRREIAANYWSKIKDNAL
jgi:hypothetical protein